MKITFRTTSREEVTHLQAIECAAAQRFRAQKREEEAAHGFAYGSRCAMRLPPG